jgi:predicted lysophospholipase L1 biosynthesis ABC-type transport system permease subunit
VAVVNETLARRYWPGEDPVGKRFHPDADPGRLEAGYEPPSTGPVTVVGVVRDFGADFYGDPPDAELYLCQDQHPEASLLLVVRSQGDPLSLIPSIRAAVARTDPAVPVAELQTGEALVDRWLQESRAIGGMLGVLGVLALGMALIGLYGMVAHSVAQRTFELGVRMVLGARRRTLELSVMRSFVRLAGVGTAVGVLIGLALGMVVRSQLANLQVPWVPMILGVTGLVMGVVVLAAWLPARRATTIEPVMALKCE